MFATLLPISISSPIFMFKPAGPSVSTNDIVLSPAPKATRRNRQRALAFDKLSSSSMPVCLVERSVFEDDEAVESEKEQQELSDDASEITLVDVQLVEEKKKKITSSVEVQTPSALRRRQIQSSWLHHTGLDINDEARNGPAPDCTVEELTEAMDEFFGRARSGEKKMKTQKKMKAHSRKRRLVEKVRECKWMV